MTAPICSLHYSGRSSLRRNPDCELYDVLADPHEENNLASDPSYAAVLTRLDEALSAWQDRYGDLGLVPEDDLLERWRPGGVWPITEAPTIDPSTGRLASATPGAVVAWTQEAPPPPQLVPDFVRLTGAPEMDGRRWRLLSYRSAGARALAGTAACLASRIPSEP